MSANKGVAGDKSKQILIYTIGTTVVVLACLWLRGGDAPVFRNLLNGADVTPQYRLVYGWSRIFWDPLCTLAYEVASKDLTWMAWVAPGYVAWRLWRRGRSPHGEAAPWRRVFGRVFGVLLLVGTAFLVVYAGVQGVFAAAAQVPNMLIALAWGTPLFTVLLRVARGAPPASSRWPVFSRAWSAWAVVVCLNFILISTELPTYRIVTDLSTGEHLLDLHAHTTLSDGFLTPEQRMRWYRRQGVGMAALTDHRHAGSAAVPYDFADARGVGFLALQGEEYTSNRPFIHFGMFYDGPQSAAPADGEPRAGWWRLITIPRAQIARDVAAAKQRGGMVVLNHYLDTAAAQRPFTLTELQALGLDGVEIANGWLDLSERGLHELKQFCLDAQLACVSGSDEHQNAELRYVMRLQMPAEAPLDVSSVFRVLKQNQHQVVAIATTTVPPLPHALRVFEGLRGLLAHLWSMDRWRAAAWLVWLLAGSAVWGWRQRRASRRANSPAPSL